MMRILEMELEHLVICRSHDGRYVILEAATYGLLEGTRRQGYSTLHDALEDALQGLPGHPQTVDRLFPLTWEEREEGTGALTVTVTLPRGTIQQTSLGWSGTEGEEALPSYRRAVTTTLVTYLQAGTSEEGRL